MKPIYIALFAALWCHDGLAQVRPHVLSAFLRHERHDRDSANIGGYADPSDPPAEQELRCLISCSGNHIVIVPGTTIWGRNREWNGRRFRRGVTAGTEGGLLGTRSAPGSFCGNGNIDGWYIALYNQTLADSMRHHGGDLRPWLDAAQSHSFRGPLALMIRLDFPAPHDPEGGFEVSASTSRVYTYDFMNLDEPFIRRIRGAQVECRLQPLQGRNHWSTLRAPSDDDESSSAASGGSGRSGSSGSE